MDTKNQQTEQQETFVEPLQGGASLFALFGQVGRKFNFGGKWKLVLSVVAGAFFVFLVAIFLRGLFSEKKDVSEKVELSYWFLDDRSQQAMQDLALEYEQKTGVKVTFLKQARQDYRERLASSLARGTGPDIFQFHNSWVPMFSSQFSSAPESVVDEASFKATFYPVAVSDLGGEKGFVGMPLWFDGLGLFVNEDIYDFSQGSVSTWDELRQAALSLAVHSQDGVLTRGGVAAGRTDNVDHWEDILSLMLLQSGVDTSSSSGERTQTALEFFNSFSGKEKVWDSTLPPSTTAFARGRLAFYFGPSWRIDEIKKINSSLRFRVLPVPQLPKVGQEDHDTSWASYWVEGVWNKGKYQKQAWEFLKFISSSEALIRLSENKYVYSRVDMAPILASDPLLGAYVTQAPSASSWYLASNTYDGDSGINSKFSRSYKTALEKLSLFSGGSSEVVLELSAQVAKILSEYSVAF